MMLAILTTERARKNELAQSRLTHENPDYDAS